MKKLKEIFRNKRLILVVVTIIIVVAFSIYIWVDTFKYMATIDEMESLLSRDEILTVNLGAPYTLAFQKIILFAGICFTSAFLLLKVMPDKKQNNE